MEQEVILKAINTYGISKAWISNIEGFEYDKEKKQIQTPAELDVNRKTLDLVKQYDKLFSGLYWIKPHYERFNEEKATFLVKNKRFFIGLKIHPYHSQTAVTDARMKDYLAFANDNALIVAVHTAADDKSDPYHVYQIAKKYPRARFILVHMGLNTNNEDAIDYMNKRTNLYGDTTWVPIEKTIEAIKKCGRDKLLFGTDAPIDGVDTYKKYQDYFDYFTRETPDGRHLFYENAINLTKSIWR